MLVTEFSKSEIMNDILNWFGAGGMAHALCCLLVCIEYVI